MPAKHVFDLEKCARPNILSLLPYRCARDEYPDNGSNVLLDANENAFGSTLLTDGPSHADDAASSLSLPALTLHRYPDPHQHELKSLFCAYRNTHAHTTRTLTPANLFIGVGSDEALDNVLRCFCVPGRDRIIITPPTYGMYSVCARINDVDVVEIPLRPAPTFELDVDAILATLSRPDADTIKAVFLCSPGNPTGACIPRAQIDAVLQHPTWNGLVVLDEAYIDFAQGGAEAASLAELVLEHANLVVLQTLSKAFGCAGIRCGAAFADACVATLMNNLKAPYNLPQPSSVLAARALSPAGLAAMQHHRAGIHAQRDRLLTELARIPRVGRRRGGLDANFLLYEILDAPHGTPCNEAAMRVYTELAERRGVVVRFRGKEHGCQGCLRITVGTPEEVTRLLTELRDVLGGEGDAVVAGSPSKGEEKVSEAEQRKASAVVA